MKTNMQKLVEESMAELLKESTRIRFANHQFILKVGVNEDPNKKGIKVQFVPTKFGEMTKTEMNDIAIELGKRLERGLSKYDMKVERDRNLKDKTVIAYFIYIEYIDKIIRKVLASQSTD